MTIQSRASFAATRLYPNYDIDFQDSHDWDVFYDGYIAGASRSIEKAEVERVALMIIQELYTPDDDTPLDEFTRVWCLKLARKILEGTRHD